MSKKLSLMVVALSLAWGVIGTEEAEATICFYCSSWFSTEYNMDYHRDIFAPTIANYQDNKHAGDYPGDCLQHFAYSAGGGGGGSGGDDIPE